MKKKYHIEQYAASNKGNPIIQNINNANQRTSCICGQLNNIGLTCFRCKKFVHSCLRPLLNRTSQYECSCCLNYYLDPLYPVEKVLVESYFRIENIFEYQNVVNFEFTLKLEDLQSIVEVRGIRNIMIEVNKNLIEKISFGWPMQGSFHLNDDSAPFHQLRPLMRNSNKKERKEEYFLIPQEKLKIGKNYLRFKIIRLDKKSFEGQYQFEERGSYYFALNLVKKITKADLSSKLFMSYRLEKSQSINLLKQINSVDAELEISSNKLCLNCPYTGDRIKIPIRGKYCKHFTCICMETFLLTHTQIRGWNCPICSEKLNEPFVDIWIYAMLNDNQKGSQVNVFENGTYQWIQNQNQEIDLDDSQESRQKPLKKEITNTKLKDNFTIQKGEISIVQHPVLRQVIETKSGNIQQKFPIVVDLEEEPIIPVSFRDKKEKAPMKSSQAIKSQFLNRVKKVDQKIVPNQERNIQVQPQEINKKIKNFKIDQSINHLKEKSVSIDDFQGRKKRQLQKIDEKKLLQKADERRSLQKADEKKVHEIQRFPAVIVDVKLIEFKQMKIDEYKRCMKRQARQKKLMSQDFKRLFKDVL